jgi:4-amino-4-deoxy-L-arabinose transferase-like glycosyltransferase
MTDVTYRDHLLGASLAMFYLAILMLTASDLAMSRDESFYVDASQSYGHWLLFFLEHPKEAAEQAAIDRFWGYNHEHPSLMKAASSVTSLLHIKWKLFRSDSLAFRFPGMVCGSLLLWLLYIFGTRLHGRVVGIVATLGFALIPRIFYHAHLHAFDVPIVLLMTLVVYCYWRSLTRPHWALWTGLAFGLALATKHNSWILPIVLLVHWVWMRAGTYRVKVTWHKRYPLALLAMVFLSPFVFIALWPWLWHDTLDRIGSYIAFHTHHAQHHGIINVAYFGKNLFRPPFPVEFPFVLTAFTLPATFVVLSIWGVALRLRYIVPGWLASRMRLQPPHDQDRTANDVLILGCLLAPLVLIALPSTPKFGGTKHWFPAYPVMAIYFGLGVRYVGLRLGEAFKQRGTRWARAVPIATASLCLSPSVAETIHSHPMALSHYTMLAGGVRGAATHGMNRQFWGFTTGSAVNFLVRNLPKGGKVWLCDTTAGAWHMLQRDGLVPKNINAAHAMADADYILVHHELHFAEVDFQAWVALSTTQPAHVIAYDGVPIISIYAGKRK